MTAVTLPSVAEFAALTYRQRSQAYAQALAALHRMARRRGIGAARSLDDVERDAAAVRDRARHLLAGLPPDPLAWQHRRDVVHAQRDVGPAGPIRRPTAGRLDAVA